MSRSTIIETSLNPAQRAAVALMLDPKNDLAAEQYLKAAKMPLPKINTARMEALTRKMPLISVWKHCAYPAARDTLEASIAELSRHVSPESIAVVRRRAALLSAPTPTLADLLQVLWIKDEDETDHDGVTVSTVHGAKGREWDHVIMAGMEEGTFPLKSGEIEEERRIAFVAVTRARHSLTTTQAKTRTRFFKKTQTEPSRFLAEIPESQLA